MTTQGLKATLVAGTLAFGLMAVSVSAQAKAANWVCLKDGKKIKVKGKTAKTQQKACEGKGGAWQNGEAKSAPTDSAAEPAAEPSPPPADSGGGGGGW